MTTNFDVAIVGGGPAGMSAALVLGRMRRRVVVLDTDAPANAISGAMHGFLSRDGTPPIEVRRIGREQLEAYETIELRRTAARSARRVNGGFELETEDGTRIAVRRLLLAHGMDYRLPELDGVSDLWGEHVFHCPYCHGWEVRDRAIAVLECGERAAHQALLLSSLSDDVVLLCDENTRLSADQRARLDVAGVTLCDTPVERIEDGDDGLRVVFRGFRPPMSRDALFIQPELSLASNLAVALGAELRETGSIETDEAGKTSVHGLYAAGDAGMAVQSVAVATGSGARAAYAVNADLTAEDTTPPENERANA